MVTLTRDAVWAVLRWLPWQEQLRVRSVCRTWCSVVHERVTATPRRYPPDALPALLRCHLRELDVSSQLSRPLLAALPTTLRRLCMSATYVRPAALSHLVQLEDLELGPLNNDDVLALGALHTLTRLQVGRAPCQPAAAALAAASLTRLHALVLRGDTPLAEALLLHAPAGLTSVELSLEIGADVGNALQLTPLSLLSLKLPRLVPLPLHRWPLLRRLDAGMCTAAPDTRSLLLGLAAACTALRALRLSWDCDDVAVARALGELTGLQDLELIMFCRESQALHDALAAEVARLPHLTVLTLGYLVLSPGRVAALTALSALHTLKLYQCLGSGVREMSCLTQLRCVALRHQDVPVLNLPASLETFICGYTQPDLAHLGRLTALRRLELEACRIRNADLCTSWSSLVRLEHIILRDGHGIAELPRMLLHDLEDTLAALRIVELVDCSPVLPLPDTSRVLVVLG